jgi:hypothetical protein
MEATNPTTAARPLSRPALIGILFDRADLEGLEVRDTSWDEWDLWSDVQLMRMSLDKRDQLQLSTIGR